MATAKELREQRAPLAEQIKRLSDKANDEKHKWSGEDESQWTKVNAAYDDLSKQISLIEKVERADAVVAEQTALATTHAGHSASSTIEPGSMVSDVVHPPVIESRLGPPKLTLEHHALALQAWMRRGVDAPLTDRHLEACKATGTNPNAKAFDVFLNRRMSGDAVWYSRGRLSGGIRNANQSVGTDTEGGFLVETGFSNALERSMLAFGGPRQVATVWRTEKGNDIEYPTLDDTSNSGRLLTESSAITTTDVVFGQKLFKAYKYTSDAVKVSSELLEDSAFNLAEITFSLLGERLARITATDFTTGNDSSKPEGLVNGSTVGVTTASATAIAADELFDHVHKLDPSYRALPSVGWMMHDNILLVVRKLKDGDGNYIWQTGLIAGEPDRLLTFPITINQDMQSSVASATKTMLFGAFEKYVIRDVANVRLFRLDELYRANDQTGFIIFSRHDGRYLNTAAVKHLLQAT